MNAENLSKVRARPQHVPHGSVTELVLHRARSSRRRDPRPAWATMAGLPCESLITGCEIPGDLDARARRPEKGMDPDETGRRSNRGAVPSPAGCRLALTPPVGDGPAPDIEDDH